MSNLQPFKIMSFSERYIEFEKGLGSKAVRRKGGRKIDLLSD